MKKLNLTALILAIVLVVSFGMTACGNENKTDPAVTTAIEQAQVALEQYSAQLQTENDYTSANVAKMAEIVSEGKTEIGKSTTVEAASSKLNEYKGKLDAVETDPVPTAIKKAKLAVDSYAADLKLRYTYDESAGFDAAVAAAKASLDSLTSMEAVDAALDLAKASLKAIVGTKNQFTYNSYSSMTADLWNPHMYESAEESDQFSYIVTGLYEFVLNESKDGYEIIPEMASEMAKDVTADYVGKYGVAENDAGKVWEVKLNMDATWENGEPITAADYVYSLEQLINSTNKNYRHTAFTTSDGELYNAAYYHQQDKAGQIDWQPIRDANDQALSYPEGSELYIMWDQYHPWVEGGVAELFEYYASSYPVFATALTYRNNNEAMTRIDNNADFQAAMDAAIAMFSGSGWETVAFYNNGSIPEVSWDEVGFFSKGDDTIVFALVNPVEEFYFYYSVVGFPFLVYEPLYEQCKTVSETGLVTSTYYTSLDTTISYGPYKMTVFQADKQIVYEQNENWYGWTDGKHEGKYMTTKIVIDVIANQATALNEFLLGNIDSVSLTSADMATYKSGSTVVYTPSSNTWKLTFNSDYEALKKREVAGVNKTLLSYSDFRKALSLSVNKADFVAKNFPASVPAFGLINYMYVHDYRTGALYRDEEIAKQKLVEYYGIEYGEGKEFATLDEAYDAMTGYDPAQAKALFASAFEAAKTAGDWNGSDVVKLELLMYSGDTTYVNVYTYINEAIKAVLADTPYAGKVEIVANYSGGSEFYDIMQAGETDIIMSAWGGGNFDPFGTIACYLDPDSYSLHEYGANISKLLTLTLPGETEALTMTLTEWCKGLNSEVTVGGVTYSWKTADAETKLLILANLEYEFLSLNANVTLWYVTGASMHSHKVQQGNDTYIQLVGFGGLRELTYNYTDSQWAAYVAGELEENGKLDYVS